MQAPDTGLTLLACIGQQCGSRQTCDSNSLQAWTQHQDGEGNKKALVALKHSTDAVQKQNSGELSGGALHEYRQPYGDNAETMWLAWSHRDDREGGKGLT